MHGERDEHVAHLRSLDVDAILPERELERLDVWPRHGHGEIRGGVQSVVRGHGKFEGVELAKFEQQLQILEADQQ